MEPIIFDMENNGNRTLKGVGFAFCVIGCVVLGCFLIPLAWCIPLTIMAYKYYKGEGDLGVGAKVCILLFVDIIAGILLLCANDEPTVSHSNDNSGNGALPPSGSLE